MIQREYLTEYDEYLHGNRYNITISTDKFHVFKAIKSYAESVCEKEDAPLEQSEEAEQKNRKRWGEQRRSRTEESQSED